MQTMTGWAEIFHTPNLKDTKTGDAVVVRIISRNKRSPGLLRKTVESATKTHILVDGIKFDRNGFAVGRRKSSATSLALFEMTEARAQYMRDTRR